MPNPFPGMNPFLENPDHWRTVHHCILGEVASDLNRTVPEGFAMFFEDRTFVAKWRADFEPSTIRESYLEIRTTDEREELIAAIEVLSPTNKTAGPGRDEYRRKQDQFVRSLVHYLEIDLLRGGDYTVAPNEDGVRQRCGAFDYIVSLHRGGTAQQFEVWPVRLRERLPRIRLPLTEEAGDVYLDLQEILNRACDERGMHRSIRYNDPLTPPLTPDDTEWVETLLRDKGLR